MLKSIVSLWILVLLLMCISGCATAFDLVKKNKAAENCKVVTIGEKGGVSWGLSFLQWESASSLVCAD